MIPSADAKISEIIKDNIELDASVYDSILDWIQRNLEIDDVFTADQIEKYVVVLPPEDWYPVEDLEEWAESNGYKKDPF